MKLRALTACTLLATLSLLQAAEPEIAFLRERVSVSTNSGVAGFAPGTRVTVISRHSGMVTVKSKGRRFDVTPDQLITDAEAARALNARDAAEQQAAQQQVAQREAAQQAAQKQQQRQPASPPDAHSTSEAQIRDIRKQRERLQIELDHIHSEQKDLPPPNSTQYGYSRHYRHDVATSIRSSPNAEKLAQHEKEVRKQIEALTEKERLLCLDSQ